MNLRIQLSKKQSQLAQLLAGILLVAIPYIGRMSIEILVLMMLLGTWSMALVMGYTKTPNLMVRIILLLVMISTLYLSYGTIFGRDAGTVFLVLLSFMKLFENKSHRDVFIIIFIGFFLIASNFFFTQEPWTAPYLFINVIYLTTLMIVFADKLNSTSLKDRIKISTRLIIQAAPLMLVLFVLFPRIPGPLWGLPKDAESAATGLSEEMSPGSLSELILSDEVAFRVYFHKDYVPQHTHLYWRGPVLSHYDGEKWTMNSSPKHTQANISYSEESSKHINYTITLNPHDRSWLLALEHPVKSIDIRNRITRENQLVSPYKIRSAIQYTVTSDLNARDYSLSDDERFKNLQLPRNMNPRTIALAQEWRFQYGDDANLIAKQALTLFAKKFTYTLTPALLGRNAMDDFLFNTREGFCEHYSSAFVYLMRAAGVPARIITGYQGGEKNPLDNYMIIRQSSAHAWAEIWIENQGWVRFDPTAAASPTRVQQGIQAAIPERDRLPNILTTEHQWLKDIQYQWDSFNAAWTEWVIGFNREKQRLLLSKFGLEKIDWQHLAIWLGIAICLVTAILMFWVLRQGKAKSNDPVKAYYQKFCQKMARCGVTRLPHEGPLDFQQRISRAFPQLTELTGPIIRQYMRIRYGTEYNDEAIRSFKYKVNQFKPRVSV